MRRVPVLIALVVCLVALMLVITPVGASAERCFLSLCYRPYSLTAWLLGENSGAVTFAIVGDQGTDGPAQRSVSDLVDGWRPDFVVSAGDNYYDAAGGKGASKYDLSVGRYFCKWMAGAETGRQCPSGGEAHTNNFYPALGNHDYSDAGLTLYLSYFDLPGVGQGSSSGNERYYDVIRGPVHLFVLNSNKDEPDGVAPDGKQARWLKQQLAASTGTWNIIVFHHAAYSSSTEHGSSEWMRWPFAEWGANAVVSGHDHTYERLLVDGIPYFVNGLGGGSRYALGKALSNSKARFNDDWGAQRVTATRTSLTFEFVTVGGKVVDTWTVTR